MKAIKTAWYRFEDWFNLHFAYYMTNGRKDHTRWIKHNKD